jgi:hypothetical protein
VRGCKISNVEAVAAPCWPAILDRMMRILLLLFWMTGLACGNGSAGEGEIDGEGEQSEGEGEEGEGEEGEGEVAIIELGTRASPTTVIFPFDEQVVSASGGDEECVGLVVNDQVMRVVASSSSPACEAALEDPVLVLLSTDGTEVARGDDGNNRCAALDALVAESGSYALCLFGFNDRGLGLTRFQIEFTVAPLADIGGLCATGGDFCDPSIVDRNDDGIPDRVACLANRCTVVEAVPAGNACNPAATDSECDPRDDGLQCLSINPDDFRCVAQVELQPGDACTPNTTAAVCPSDYRCDEDRGCVLPSLDQCLLAEAIDANTAITIALEPRLTTTTRCGDATEYVVRSFQPNQPAVVTVSSDGIVAMTSDCNEPATACGDEQTPVSLVSSQGDPIYLFIAGNDGQQTINITIVEQPVTLLSENEPCALFNQQERCESGLVCQLGGCGVPPSLSLDQPQPLQVREGDQQCFQLDLPDGRYRFATAGECSNQNDLTFVSVELTQNGRRTLGTDIDNNTFCQQLTATIAGDDDNLLCVATLEGLGPIDGVTLTIEPL